MSNSEPICFIPLTKNSPQIELKPKNVEAFPNSFIVCILAFIEPFFHSNFETFVSITDDRGTSISIGVEDKQLVFHVANKDKQRNVLLNKFQLKMDLDQYIS